MAYPKNTRVTLNKDITVGIDTVIPKGTKGTVKDYQQLFERYIVDFDNGQTGIKVKETNLEAA